MGHVQLFAFALMGNHSHQLLQYSDGCEHLSNYMRSTHTSFGRNFNDRNNRSGKVGNDRPKTPLIEDSSHSMRVHFYIEANPIRAGICNRESLKTYPYSSYGFYAFGIENRFTSLLSIPDWYLELGDTPAQRQKKYRKLFDEYLVGSSMIYTFHQTFIGSDRWIEKSEDQLRFFQTKRLAPSTLQMDDRST
ncbi:MAG: hypothetical protein KDD61_16780 [Bdellovibrionales bacterium]|nr:hypothetical protein [Bdellovibrionales bacterium]